MDSKEVILRRHVRIAFVLAALGVWSAAARAQDIPVAAGFVLSGPIAAYGEDAKIGVDLGAAEINAKGGVLGRKLKVEYEDTGADRAKAVAIYRKFGARPEVPAFLSISTIELVALDPVAGEVKLPLISVGSAAPMAKFSPYTFRVQLIVNKALPAVFSLLKEQKGAKSIAVIYDTVNNYNVGEMESVKAAAPPAGIEVKAIESFSTGDQNFSLQLTNIAQTNPDLLYVAATTNEAALIIAQARGLGIKAQILGGAGLNDNRIFALPGKAAHGIMTFFPFDAKDQSPVVQTFVKLYAEKYKKDLPPAYVALGYDTIHLVAEAIKRAGSTDREAVRKALGETSYDGANGKFRYQGSGDNLEQRPHIFAYGDNGYERISK
jgi:branched-chain amino acid transport system substrate-binding protein